MKQKRIDTRLAYINNLLSPFTVCHALLQDAVHRCKDSKVPTRITVTLTRVVMTDKADTVYRVSVADTGYGVSESMLHDFFPYHTRGGSSEFSRNDLHWDGVLFIITTCDNEQFIHHYEIKLEDRAVNHKVIQTCVQPKRQVFRGTESSVLVEGNFTALQLFIQDVCKKDVFLELCDEIFNHPQKQEINCLSLCDGGKHAEQALSLDRLHLGLETYTLKYIYKYTEESADQGLSKWAFKVGKTQTVIDERPRGALWTMQVCFLLTVSANHDEDMLPCQPERYMRTQVVFFNNHSLCLQIPKMILRALSKVNWSKIGFGFKTICQRPLNAMPCTVIEWNQYPEAIERLDVVLHNISDTSEDMPWKEEFQVVKDTIDAALIDLKAKSPQLLSTPHENQVRTGVPSLAGCISGIITSSKSQDFREDCARILGISPRKTSITRQVVEANLFAALEVQNDVGEEDQESSIPDSEETLDILEKAEQKGGYNSDSERVDIWNYL